MTRTLFHGQFGADITEVEMGEEGKGDKGYAIRCYQDSL